MKIPQSWTFDNAEVAEAFDGHVREQLPWYELVTASVAQIARHYISRGGLVYDIGASNGNVGRAIAETLSGRKARLVAVEPAAEMVATYRGPGVVLNERVEDVVFQPFDLAVSMLALMFVSPSHVSDVIDRLIAAVRPGGAILIVERTLPPNGYPGIVTSRLTLAAKASQGASAEQIVAKELSLAGVQRPLSADLLLSRGAVEWFRFGDFAGYLLEPTPEPPKWPGWVGLRIGVDHGEHSGHGERERSEDD